MKIHLAYCWTSLVLFTIASAGDIPDDARSLIEKRDEAVARIDLILVGELEKLKIKYTQLGDLDSAVNIVGLIEHYSGIASDTRPPDAEFDGTSWAFHNRSGRLGVLHFLAGGKIESKEYPNSSWIRIDEDTIRFQYHTDESSSIAGGHVTFRFQDAERSKMSGKQSELGTPRYLHKITK